MRPPTTLLTSLLTLAIASAAFAADQPTGVAPLDYLRGAVADPAMLDSTFNALRATRDKDLLPLFAAAAVKGGNQTRSFAVSVLADVGGIEAASILFDRVKNDPSPTVKAEALAHVINLKVVTPEQLIEMLQASDPTLRCLAARAMVRQGKAPSATAALNELVKSPNLATACLARMTLLGLGDASQAAPLDKIIRDPSTPQQVLLLLTEQIAEEKVAAAANLARYMADNATSMSLRVRAYRALASVGPGGAAVLAEVIGKTDQTVLRVQLLHILAEMPDARGELETLSIGSDAIAALARLELVRPAGGVSAASAAQDALAQGHSVVIDYVLGCAQKDIAAGKGDFYIQPLLTLVRSAGPDATVMKEEHTYAARAATLLADLASPDALKALGELLTGPHNATVRATAAGVLLSKNQAVANLIRPLLSSPYEELYTDAALTLGHLGDGDARPILRDILANPKRHSPEMVILASWYLLKISGQTAQAGRELADSFHP